MSAPAVAEIKTSKPLRTGHVIMADGSKTAPTEIEVLRAGTWPASSMKGPMTITTADLQEFKANFDAGIGMPKGLKQLPIDFSHDSWDKAAGWMTALTVVGDSLMAAVEWSDDGKAALEGGMFKCISPSFWPACCGEWYDPEDPDNTARNVLVGAGLTNIPFFSDLQPVMASTKSKEGKATVNENIIYIEADKKEPTMTLDEIRVKEASVLNDDEKKFLADNKKELSAEELKKFSLEEEPAADPADPADPPAPADPADDPSNKPVSDPEMASITADIKSGKRLVVDAAQYNKLTTDVKAMKRKEIEASVDTHIARGAIKADQKDKWADLIEADEKMAETLTALPDNPILAGTQGASEGAASATAVEAMNEKAQAIVDADKSETPITFNAAFKKAMNENPDLAKQLNDERE